MAQKNHKYTSGRIRREGAEFARELEQSPRRRQRVKKNGKKRNAGFAIFMVLVILLGLGATGVGAAYLYLDSLLDGKETGVIASEHYTPKEYQGDVINILLVGVYRENDSTPRGLGLTDMILYANFDLKNNKLNLLQIPRDSYVGEISGSDGKINSLMMLGPDREDPINNLVSVITDQYKLPIDRYVCIDMAALKEIVAAFGSIYVYVPREMNYQGSHLDQGWQWLGPESVEFFVRNRHGNGFERADIDRLDNQRHFYSALFRRFMNLTIQDVLHLMPVFQAYCSTDISTFDLYDLALSALKLEPEGVMICKVPGATSGSNWQADPTGAGRTLYVTDVWGRGTEEEPGVANLLNKYFRTYGEPVGPDALNLPKIEIPAGVALYPPNVQQMQEIQDAEGGAEINVEPGQ